MLRNRLLVSLVTASFLQFSCAANRARVITPNDDEVQVLDGTVPIDFDNDGKTDGHTDFVRGKGESLDEQEFYQAIGDTASYDTVKGSRGAGFALQGVGLAGMMLGLAGAGAGVATWFLSDPSDETRRPVLAINEETRPLVMYGVYGSAALAVLGGVLFFAMAGKARGDHRVFDLSHARKRLEVSLYGENGATPDDITRLVFGQGNEGQGVCVGGALTLAPLVAYDARGRKMKVVDRADWFQWLTTLRPSLVDMAPDAPVLHSPLGDSFGDVESDVGLTVKVSQTGVGHSMTFPHDFRCGGGFVRDGRPGEPGDPGEPGGRGRSGSSSRAPERGQRGHPGKPGTPGQRGPSVVAEVAWVTTAKQGRLAVLVVDGQGTVFDPSVPVSVSAAGGRGGRGGRGGHGGQGGSASGCMAGGDGGDGGTGGEGGTGGPGGSVVLRAADPGLLRAVRLLAPGGAGGTGGDGGSRGDHGSRGTCKKGWPPEGAKGQPGAPGGEGSPGEDGSTRTELVPLAELSQVSRFVRSNPTLTLEAGAAAVTPPSGKKRK